MRKKRTLSALAIVFAFAVLCLCFLPRAAEPVKPIAFSGARDILRAEFDYDAGTRTLRGTQTMTITNRTGEDLEEIILRAQMNARDESAVAVTGVSVNGQAVRAAWDEEDQTTMRIPCGWTQGSTAELRFTVMIRHEKQEGAAVVTLPQLAMHESGVWRTDAFDALSECSYAQPFDFSVTVEGETAAQMEGARDASFVLGGRQKEKNVGGVYVSVSAADGRKADDLLSCAQEALESLDEAGFAYPFPALTVAQTQSRAADGDVYSGMVALRAQEDREETIRQLTRLIARQTFGILVENDPWNAPWLSVSVASAAEMLAYRVRRGDGAFETRFFGQMEVASRLTRPQGVNVGAGTAFFGSDAEMTQVLRDQGGAMLIGIEEAVGTDVFVRALTVYADACAGKTAVQQDLEDALFAASGSRWDGYLADMLRE